jgi:hypothetical protein
MNRSLLVAGCCFLAACGQKVNDSPQPEGVSSGSSSSGEGVTALSSSTPTTTQAGTNTAAASSVASTSTGHTTSAENASSNTTASTPITTSEAHSSTSTGESTTSEAVTSTAATSDAEESSVSTSTEAGMTSSVGEALNELAADLDGFYMHDECTNSDPSSDVCEHEQVHEESFTFGGDAGVTYELSLRIRGLFEPTNVADGMTPYPEHPYFKVGGTVTKTDYSQWQIRVSEPQATYYLNHYPATGHTIYQEDFEATIPIRGGAQVTVRVEDSNTRQIDNGYVGLPDRQQEIDGVTDGVIDGQVLRLDVLSVVAKE